MEQNKAIVNRTIKEGWNRADLSVIDELYDRDFVFHQEGDEDMRGIDSFKQWVTTIHTAFPAVRYTMYTIEAMYEGDKVATRYTVRGTHQGDFEACHRPVDPSTLPAI